MRRTITAFAATALALAICGFVPAQDAPEEAEWQKFEFRGETVYRIPDALMREMGFDVPEIPDERNAAIIFLNAVLIYERKDIPWEEYNRLMNDPWTAEEFPEVAEWLERNRPAFDLVDQALALDEINFPMFLRAPDSRFITHYLLTPLTISRDMARTLKISANLHAGEGRTDEAIEDAMRMVGLGHLASRGQGIISSLIGVAHNHMGTDSMKAIVSRGGLTGEQLATLQDRLEHSRRLLPDQSWGLRSEREFVLITYDLLIDLSLEMAAEAPENADNHLKAFLQGRVWNVLYPDRTLRKDIDDHYERLIEYANQPAWEREEIDNIFAEAKPYNFIVNLLFPVIGRYLDEHSACEAGYEALIQGVAILRYHADHEAYPTELNALMPDYLDALPPDPFTGQPFRYIAEEDGFIVYSVGMNRADDEGRTHDDRPWGDDIVFRIRPDQE